MDEEVRCFIALDLPSDIRATVAKVGEIVACHWPYQSVKWTGPDNIHLTLRFLGKTDTAQLASLREALDGLVTEEPPFELTLTSVGAFPNPGRPRVLWVGLDSADHRLQGFQKRVERTVRDLGWDREAKLFQPHLTFGRIRPKAAKPIGDWEVSIPGKRFGIGEVVLMESVFQREGVEYRPIHYSAFSG